MQLFSSVLYSYDGMIIRPCHYENISDEKFLSSLEGESSTLSLFILAICYISEWQLDHLN